MERRCQDAPVGLTRHPRQTPETRRLTLLSLGVGDVALRRLRPAFSMLLFRFMALHALRYVLGVIALLVLLALGLIAAWLLARALFFV
jgi:hypothetical protein